MSTFLLEIVFQIYVIGITITMLNEIHLQCETHLPDAIRLKHMAWCGCDRLLGPHVFQDCACFEFLEHHLPRFLHAILCT